MQLRPYQIDAKRAVLQKLIDYRSTMVEMATGLGKTVLFGHIAHEWPGRVLVIAHRDELIRQAAQKIIQITGDDVGIEMGRSKATDTFYGTKCVVASIQTLSRARRRSAFHPDHFSLIVIDEGHHAAAVTYREVLDYFTSAKHLFVTATPLRSDQVAMESVCQSVAYQYGIEAAIDDGWLCPVQQMVVQVDGLDFSKARTVADDFNGADLERILTEEKPLHAMVSSAHELISHRQALWFCASVVHARATAGVLGRYAGENNVVFLSGDTPKDERVIQVERYKRGDIQHLVNCALFLEGFDAPATSCIVMGKPTKSLSLYMQVLGRGTRPLPGIVDGIETADGRKTAIASSEKPHMTVIDYAGNAGKHKIIQAADVLGGKHEPPVREYAKKTMAEEGRAFDLSKALERAELEMALLDEEGQFRKKIIAKAEFRTVDVDPFVKRYNGTLKNSKPPVPEKDRRSDKQARYILYLSRITNGNWTIEALDSVSNKQARGIIGNLRKQAGL